MHPGLELPGPARHGRVEDHPGYVVERGDGISQAPGPGPEADVLESRARGKGEG